MIFLWNGVDKVKLNALINDIEDGGLKMIHLESLIQAQKISFFKRYADPDYVADWKNIVDTYLKPFGGPYILRCNYDLSYLSIRTSSFY